MAGPLRLLEPLGWLDGAMAGEAVARGLALPLAGGPAAFTLVRLLPGGEVLPVARVPPPWQAALARLGAPRPRWAGLATSPAVMGILNVTPDSFSDGGRHADPERAVAAGLSMIAAGAALIDVGGESTRPGAAAVSPAEEQARVLPVVRKLAAAGIAVSVDTRNGATMAACLDAGARVINDVSALTHDPAAAAVVAARRCPVVLMHMRGEPQTMAGLGGYADVALEVTAELAERVAAACAAGVAEAAIALDPGIGFAKDAETSAELLRRLGVLACLGLPLVVGVSRKSFLGVLGGAVEPSARLPSSLAAGLAALLRGAAVLRVHDVAATMQALRVWRALCG
jgi:dihydropteroate synthase